ncbi:MAG: hypothetical protein M1837_005213 [Sclerophora amabilis]|nr:MAG: hypothetical protein M1837_005213 [Sclerophora amabilis]
MRFKLDILKDSAELLSDLTWPRKLLASKRKAGDESNDDPIRATGKASFKRPFHALRDRLSRRPSRLATSSKLDKEACGYESSKKDISTDFAATFFALPLELQLEIITYLAFGEVLDLRQTSRSFFSLIHANEGTIVQGYVTNAVPQHMLHVYPPPIRAQMSLNYLSGLARRQIICSKLAWIVAGRLIDELGVDHSSQCRRVIFARTRLQKRMIPDMLTVFHLLETFREEYANWVIRTGSQPRPRSLLWTYPDHLAILRGYDVDALVGAREMLLVLRQLFAVPLLPRMGTGRLRPLRRRWVARTLCPQDMSRLMLLGGIEQVCRVWDLKGQGRQRRAVRDWLEALQQQVQREPGPVGEHLTTRALGTSTVGEVQRDGGVAAAEERQIDHGIGGSSVTVPMSPSWLGGLLDHVPGHLHMWTYSYNIGTVLRERGIISPWEVEFFGPEEIYRRCLAKPSPREGQFVLRSSDEGGDQQRK